MTARAQHARSLLFVPGDRPERFAKAQASGADAVIVDLEDAVAPSHKEAALDYAVEWLRAGNQAVVRVNAVGTARHDIEIDALADTDAWIMVPKSHSDLELEAIHRRIGDRIIALVETARGVRDVNAVAAAPGVVRLALGNVDLAAELGVDPASHPALAHARSCLVMASAAAGITAPIDGVTTALDSPDALALDLVVTRELGFGGKLCIHPRQVAAVGTALRPSADEVAWARHVIQSATSDGVSVVGGLMVDPPVIRRAERVLAGGTISSEPAT